MTTHEDLAKALLVERFTRHRRVPFWEPDTPVDEVDSAEAAERRRALTDAVGLARVIELDERRGA